MNDNGGPCFFFGIIIGMIVMLVIAMNTGMYWASPFSSMNSSNKDGTNDHPFIYPSDKVSKESFKILNERIEYFTIIRDRCISSWSEETNGC